MGNPHDIEDPDSSTLAESSFLKRSIVARTRTLFGRYFGRHFGHDSQDEQDGHSSHGREQHRFQATNRPHPCGSILCGSEDSLPMPLFVRPDSADVEKTTPLYQNIKLSVSGMTCSGCEKSLQRALEKLPSAKNIHTDMAHSQAVLCIDVNTISVDEALQHLRRTTPYGIKLVCEAKEGNQFLDVLVNNPHRLFHGPPPRGVKSVRCQAKTDNIAETEVRIEYDPRSILPRDLTEKTLAESNVKLAPIPPPDCVTAGRRHLHRELMYFVVALVFTIPVLVLVWAPLSIPKFKKEIACLFLASVVQGSAWEFYPNAFKSLFHARLADMDLLIVLSTTIAYVFSVVAFVLYGTGRPLQTGSFFETSTLLVTLIRLGRYMSELARQKATESVSIRTLQAPTAQLLTKARNGTREIDVRLLQLGDTFRVPPHTRIPTDGVVVYGGSQVDESMMSGESRPVAKGIDSHVIAGTMNLDGQLDISLTRMAWENSISQIGALVDNAKTTKPKIQTLADRVAGFFVPTIITVSVIVFVVWITVGILVRRQSPTAAIVKAISYAVATLIVSCPCAIGLAVPMVIIITSGVAANHGVIFRAPATIETARTVTHVVVDKTGTLTEGKLSVKAGRLLGKPKTSTLPYLLGLVSGQKHPVASAVTEWILAKGTCPSVNFDTTTVVVGSGIEGKLNQEEVVVRAGNCDWLGITSSDHVLNFTRRIAPPPSPSTESPVHQHALDYTLFGVTVNHELCALFALQDVLRPETASVISTLQARHISISIVSGDDRRSVEHCARLLNVPPSHTLHRCSPAQKAEYVESLQKTDPRSVVLFLGDGTNDAVALTQATIGMSIAGGTDVAKSAADIVLARPDLRGLLIAMDVSARAVRRVRFNFAWAAIYNFFAVLLAAGAFVWVKASGKSGAAAGDENGGIKIPPKFAGLGEIVSVLPVVLIAFSLRFAKFTRHGGQSARTE